MNDDQNESFILIPAEKLDVETLEALVEEFILREGTDYGHAEVTLEDKKKRIFQQLSKEKIKIVYSSQTENCTLMKTTEIPQ